ncbi:MAG: hypothetical protein ACOX18_08575 [Bacillota bacterium]
MIASEEQREQEAVKINAPEEPAEQQDAPKQQSFLLWMIIGIVLGYLTFTILPRLGF